jgi:hypothetical protein
MDGGGLSHYVATAAALAGGRANGIWLLELLLFLSAMFAGLTGLISGERAVETRQVERAAVAASAVVEAGAKTGEAAVRLAAPHSAQPIHSAAPEPSPGLVPLELAQAAPVDERRLE